MRVAIVLFDGFDELDAIGPFEVLREAARRGTVATVCTGGMIAAAAGLVAGRPAVTHHSALRDLEAAGAEVVRARVVDDGDLVTAGGVTSGLDLALRLVERHFGAELADAIADELEYERRGDVRRGPG